MNGKTNDTARKWLTRLSLAAGIAFTAHAEFNLAKAMGADPLIAAMLPVAIDAYAMAALRWFKGFDIALSLSLMGAAQIAAHLLDAQLVTVNVTMVTVVSLLVPVSIWRTHALARGDHADSAEVTTPVTSKVTIERADIEPATGHVAPLGLVTRPVIELPAVSPVWHESVTSKVTSVPAQSARKVVTEVIALTPSDLLKRALKLNRELVTSGGRPVTIDRLRDEFGLSRREAAELRRSVVAEVAS